jgi:hypothetical protein
MFDYYNFRKGTILSRNRRPPRKGKMQKVSRRMLFHAFYESFRFFENVFAHHAEPLETLHELDRGMKVEI